MRLCLGQVAQLVGVLSRALKYWGFSSRSGHMPRMQVRSPVPSQGMYERQPPNVSPSLFLSLSLPFSLPLSLPSSLSKINKRDSRVRVFKKERKKSASPLLSRPIHARLHLGTLSGPCASQASLLL